MSRTRPQDRVRLARAHARLHRGLEQKKRNRQAQKELHEAAMQRKGFSEKPSGMSIVNDLLYRKLINNLKIMDAKPALDAWIAGSKLKPFVALGILLQEQKTRLAHAEGLKFAIAESEIKGKNDKTASLKTTLNAAGKNFASGLLVVRELLKKMNESGTLIKKAEILVNGLEAMKEHALFSQELKSFLLEELPAFIEKKAKENQ
ncbi:hypothetical protein HZB89_01345 [archaeon]|nr:hypothetical protein [archaeon]